MKGEAWTLGSGLVPEPRLDSGTHHHRGAVYWSPQFYFDTSSRVLTLSGLHRRRSPVNARPRGASRGAGTGQVMVNHSAEDVNTDGFGSAFLGILCDHLGNETAVRD